MTHLHQPLGLDPSSRDHVLGTHLMGPVVPSEARGSIQRPSQEVHVIGPAATVMVQSILPPKPKQSGQPPPVLGIPLASPASMGLSKASLSP